jgi:hypothetical protein
LIDPKRTFLRSKFLKNKYGCEGFEEMNNFLYRNFFVFEMDFEIKIWKFNVCFDFMKLIKIARNGLKIKKYV